MAADGGHRTAVTLRVYDLVGRRVRTLVNDDVKPGYYTTKWDGKDEQGKKIANGVYFIRLEVNAHGQDARATKNVMTKKTILVK